MRRPSLITRAHWSATLPVNHLTEFQLLLQTFAVGLQDIVLLQDFMCFASGQTGNTVKLATGFAATTTTTTIPGSSHRSYSSPCLILPAVSIASFITGVFITGRLAAYFGPRKRVLQVLLVVVQTCALTAAALVLEYSFSSSSSSSSSSPSSQNDNSHKTKVTPNSSQHYNTLDPSSLPSRLSLALLASATASQIAAARAWDLPEITTAMATGALVDLFNDARFFERRNRGRDLRVLFLIVLVAGCASAAGLRRWAGLGAPGLLGVSVGVKAVVVGVLGGMGGCCEGENKEGDAGEWDRMSVDGNGAGDGADVEEGRTGMGVPGGRKPG